MQISRRTSYRSTRDGVAAVEAAVVTPLIMLLFLGAVDTGQFANCYQKVSDASREGARVAARFGSSNTDDVEEAVLAYLGDMFPTVPAAKLAAATQVTVRDEQGNAVVGGNLGGVDTGDDLEVEVSLQFDEVRWITGLPMLTGSDMQAVTIMRRE